MAIAASVAISAHPASAKGPTKVLGRDAKGDAPQGLDLTSLVVGRFRDDLGVMIGLDEMGATILLHNVGRVGWAFRVDNRSFMVEGRLEGTQARFHLYEITSGTSKDLGEGYVGHYDNMNGFIGVVIPFDVIGAETGSVVSGASSFGRDDTMAYVGLPTNHFMIDGLDTKKSFVIPSWD